LTKARKADEAKLVFALNIPLVGQDVAKRLLGAYPLGELVEKAETTQDPQFFSSIDGIGPEKSAAFITWFKDPENMAAFKDLLTEIEVQRNESAPEGNRCEGLTFVVTGDVYQYANRNALKAYIESQGGKVTGSVSKSTSFLINNDLESTSSKNTKAKSLGIEIISEEEFIRRFA